MCATSRKRIGVLALSSTVCVTRLAGSVAIRKFDNIGTLPVVAQRRRHTTDSVQLRDEILIATEPPSSPTTGLSAKEA